MSPTFCLIDFEELNSIHFCSVVKPTTKDFHFWLFQAIVARIGSNPAVMRLFVLESNFVRYPHSTFRFETIQLLRFSSKVQEFDCS